MNLKVRSPVVRSSWMTSVPVMSAGIRSGVNWMRLKLRLSVRLSVEISRVFASPGTPTSRQWPRAKIETSSSSMTASWPTMTLWSSLRMVSYPCFRRSTASRSEAPASGVAPSAGGVGLG
jgi:hypothetical protein